MSGPATAPRGFRRRLGLALLSVGLLPLALGAVVGTVAMRAALSVSLSPVERVLDRASTSLEACGRAPDDAELAQARLLLAEAELARGALQRLAPRALAAVLGLSALAFAGAAWLVTRRLSRPIDQLTEGVQRYARGELDFQLASPRGPRDELALLVEQFNRMGAELLAQRERLQRTERIAAWQDAARALAHELKNPLTAMRMAAARIARALDRGAAPGAEGEPWRESAALLQEELEVLSKMTQSFSELARLPAAAFERVELRALLGEVCALYDGTASAPIERARGGEPLWLRADPHQLRRAFGNLVKNAVEAGTGPVELAVNADEARVRVEVRDRGAGLPPGFRLEAPATTKTGGSGLGLMIVQKILLEHGGSLALVPREGGGTCAVVELPRVSTE